MSQSQPRGTGISLRKKVLFSAIVFFGFFGLVECSLMLAGLGGDASTSDPFVGFSNQFPLFVADETEPSTHVQTAENKLVWFNDQRFTRVKPPGVRRVFCVGGSTTFGRPYSDSTSFCGWLREFLPLTDEDTEWEVINAGGVSYASYRVAAVMAELVEFEPDLFVVYSGQNEFLERRTFEGMFDQSALQRNVTALMGKTRTFKVLKGLLKPDAEKSDEAPNTIKLAGEVDEMLNHTIGPSDYHRDPEWRSAVVKDYEANLERMRLIAKQSDAGILFVVPASNEKDCSPFKSELKSGIGDSSREEFEQLIQNLDRVVSIEALDETQKEAGRERSATIETRIEQLRAAKVIDDGYAEADFELGRVLFASDAMPEAKLAFQTALNNDVCPLRATTGVQAAVRRLAEKSDVMLVDFDERLRQRCELENGHRILGKEYFLDHVHPTINIHQQLALWILEELRSRQWCKGAGLNQAQIDGVDQRVRAQIDGVAQGIALRNLAKVLHWSGKFSEAAPRARDALGLLPNDPESLLVLADCLRQTNQLEDAILTCQLLVDVEPMYALAYLLYGELLVEQQSYQEAVDVCTFAALALPPGSKRQLRAELLLGITYLQLEEFRKADEILFRLYEENPRNLETMAYLAQSKEGIGNTFSAMKIYQQMIKQAPEDAEPHQRLGILLLKERRYEEAQRCFENVLEIDADDQQASVQLEIAKRLAGNRSESPVKIEDESR
ncbi:tetratricopeptide repeat protein [Rubripirellula sp.]|nr:tetratricopeptide repeat protein [Planctomycetaceae bacterium]MDA9857253.1 tetratricopeptide repeat protein [Rubripirellula sp.]